MPDLTALLTAPPRAPEPTCWQAALGDARSVLAELAVRRAGGGPFRITDHEVRVARATDGVPGVPAPGFTWSTRTARRSIGLAAVRLLAGGRARSPLEAVRARVDESSSWVREGKACATQLDRWLAALPSAGRAAVEAEAVTWATRLWCALDWTAFDAPPVIGRDHWWDSPHSSLLALRGRADVRTAGAHLVVLTGPRRDSVRAELALVALVEALRGRPSAPPGRVVGWWPDSGHHVRLEPEPTVLGLGAEAVAEVVGAGRTLRAAA
jgi:hypothetical protein